MLKQVSRNDNLAESRYFGHNEFFLHPVFFFFHVFIKNIVQNTYMNSEMFCNVFVNRDIYNRLGIL